MWTHNWLRKAELSRIKDGERKRDLYENKGYTHTRNLSLETINDQIALENASRDIFVHNENNVLRRTKQWVFFKVMHTMVKFLAIFFTCFKLFTMQQHYI